jgi:predicted tellurium resistance membrane protein TerC
VDLSFSDPQLWISLITLSALEIVLGIDNLIFIAIVAERLPEHQRARARMLGLAVALFARLVMLAGAAWIVGLTAPVFSLLGQDVSWRDVLLFAGGLFLLAKATLEIHHEVEADEPAGPGEGPRRFGLVVGQIVLLDVVFSFDSVMTAVGMTDDFPVMAAAVVIAMIVMLVANAQVAAFVNRHPTVKMLALSFLILIGVALIADSLHFHIPKAYIYFALAFSVGVESLNLWAGRARRRARERRRLNQQPRTGQ